MKKTWETLSFFLNFRRMTDVMSISFSTKVQKYKTVAEANPSLKEKFFTMVFLNFGEVF